MIGARIGAQGRPKGSVKQTLCHKSTAPQTLYCRGCRGTASKLKCTGPVFVACTSAEGRCRCSHRLCTRATAAQTTSEWSQGTLISSCANGTNHCRRAHVCAKRQLLFCFCRGLVRGFVNGTVPLACAQDICAQNTCWCTRQSPHARAHT